MRVLVDLNVRAGPGVGYERVGFLLRDETAVILGDVTIGRDCSIWYNAVLRGDVNKIVIGDRTNIQDGVVLHTIYDKAKHPSQTQV